MQSDKLFALDTRVQPAIAKPYILTFKLSEQR